MTDFEAAEQGAANHGLMSNQSATAPLDEPYRGFEDWYVAAWPRVQRMLTAYCGSRPVATEAAAEAFVIAAEHWPDPSRRPGNPDAWVVTVAFNRLKKHHRRAELEREARCDAPDQVSPERDLDLWAAVAQLPPRMRQAMVLRYLGDLTEPMIAEVMGRSTGYVSSALSQARNRLLLDTSVSPRTARTPDREEP